MNNHTCKIILINFLICSLAINPYIASVWTYFVTPGVAPTVQALHLFKLFIMLQNNVTKTFMREMNLR